jgi:hypothetical protein
MRKTPLLSCLHASRALLLASAAMLSACGNDTPPEPDPAIYGISGTLADSPVER